MLHSMATLGELERALQDQNELLREAYGCLVQRGGTIALSVGVLESVRESCRVRCAANSRVVSAHWVRC